MSVKRSVVILLIILTSLGNGLSNTVARSQEQRDWIRAIAWSPDGTKIATAKLNGAVQIWSSTGGLIRTLKEADGKSAVSVSWSPDGSKLASGGLGELYIWDTSDGQILLTPNIYSEGYTVFVDWNPDGSKLAVVSFAGRPNNFWILDAISGDILYYMESITDMYDVDWSSNNDKLATAGGNVVQVWQLGELQPQVTFGGGGDMFAMRWSPDGSQIASSNDYILRTWDATTGTLIKEFDGHEGYTGTLDWSPDGSKLASTSDDGTIRVWNAVTAETLDVIEVGTRPLTVAWSPDGKRLVHGGEAGIVQMYVIPAYKPSSLSAALLTFSETELSWVDNSSDEMNFSIERSTTGTSDWSEIGTAVADSTTYTDSTVNPSTTYYYRVRAYRNSDDQYSEYSNVASILTVPATPSGLGVVAGPSGRAYLSWQDNSSDETLFNIERSSDGTTWEEIGAVQTDVISLEDAGLEPSTMYWYRVRAYRDTDDQYSDYTPSVSVLTAPTGPSQSTAILSAPNQIQINWADNSIDESEFGIERSANGIDWAQIGTAVADATTYTDTTANPSTTYYYRVRAYRSSDNVFSAYSAASSSVLSSPATPASFTGVPLPINKTRLTWTDSTTDETNFRLERSPNGSTDWLEIATVPADMSAYEDTGLTPSTTYWYRIRAYRDTDNQYSEYTQAVSVLIAPAAPSQVVATLSAPNQIQISWTDNSTDETNFHIERSTTGTSDWSEIGIATATTTYTDSTTSSSTTYYYRVRAYRSSDNVFSDYSAASLGILSSPATPAGFAGVPLPINKAKLMWTDSTTDETNFRLERSDNGTSGWSEIIVPANQATYTETRTNCIQTSYYRIRAYRGSDSQYSAFSPVVSVTTDGCGPDRLALFNTVHTHNRRFAEFPGTTYSDYWLNAPVGSGQWFMGDWNGDGIDTPAVFVNGTYWYTNSQAASSTWTQINVQANEYPVVGRFDLSIGHDCLGVIDSIVFPPTTVFMLGYTCNLTGGTNPNLSFQWLGGILPDGQYTGEYQFVSGDWNGDGVDTIAARRSEYIAYTNVAPGQNATFDQAQYFGNPYNGQYGGLYGALVAGDWNYDGIDTFGYFYVDGNFYWRNHLEWNQPISGSALISNPYGTNVLPTTWRN